MHQKLYKLVFKNLFHLSIIALSLWVFCPLNLTAQGTTSDEEPKKDKPKKEKKKKAKLPPEDISGVMLANAQYNFSSSNLKGAIVKNPTSLQFGPDGRLYVSQQNGLIKVFTIKRNGTNDYIVTATETINTINLIPNYNDDGTLNAAVTTRQVTSIVVKGTPERPVIYVTSSDSRIGGPSGDLNLDTNSGILSLLTWNGSSWDKVDLVRGFPRSEENHSTNGIQLDEKTNIMYLVIGGNTNAGSPSTNFAYSVEYALSAAVISIDLNVINAMPTIGSGNAAYKYDLPTLDDPTRPNNADGRDIGDPFGGNDGLNQAKIIVGGPVQIYSPGYRNAYDLVITQGRRMYTIDNGGNQGWGGYPDKEGTALVTNNYVKGEPGSTSASPTEAKINNLDNFHYIGNIDNYVPGSYYAGHPHPTRANPNGAGLYTHNGTTGIWRTSKTDTSKLLPLDWPPVPAANPIEGDFQMPGVGDNALLTFNTSTNGIAEYTASNFNNGLKGSLLTCSFDGNIYKLTLSEGGSDITNPRSSTNKLNLDLPFASNFGSQPLDITTQGDNNIFPGTVWIAGYGYSAVTVFEPSDALICSGLYTDADDDHDGYTNADEIDNASQPCSASSRPSDSDNDLVSDLNDNDDDNDGLSDSTDVFALDINNGSTTSLPIQYDLFNNYPGTGLFGLGFTGLMSNNRTDYYEAYEDSNLIAGGAVGAFSIVSTSQGDALGTLNTQENAFQLGVKLTEDQIPFTVQSRMLAPFFNGNIPANFQSQGIYIGNGDQDNYLKITLSANEGQGGIEVVHEIGGIANTYKFPLAGGIPNSTLDLLLSINSSTGKVQPKYTADNGEIVPLGDSIQLSGSLLNVLKGSRALAVGIIATSRESSPFTATWDYINVTANEVINETTEPIVSTGSWRTVTSTGVTPVAREENAYVAAGGKYYLMGGRTIMPVQVYDPKTNTWVNKSAPPMELHHFQGVMLDGLIYVAGAFTGPYPHEVPVADIYNYDPVSDIWIKGAAIPEARRRGAAGAAVYNNKIYLVSGIKDGHYGGWVKWFDEYDPTTNTWKTLPDAPRARDHFHAVVVGDKLYLTGGRRSSAATGQTFSLLVPEVDVYDFTTGVWTTLDNTLNLPIPRAAGGTVVLGKEIIVIGGESTQPTAHNETHAFDITTNTWRRLADLQQGRHGTQAIVNNDSIWIVAGAGNQGGSPKLSSQEVFSMYNALNKVPIANAGTPKTITLPVNSTVLDGSASDSDGTIITYEWTQVNGPSAATYTPGNYVSAPTIGGLVAGSYTFDLTVTDDKGATSEPSQVIITVNNTELKDSVVYRINSGGKQVINSIGTFAADSFYTPVPGHTYSVTTAINGTTNDAIYQSERGSTTNNGTFSYNFPVSNGQYKVILHFSENYQTAAGKRVFDVSAEGVKVLDNYDIYQKVGRFTAITESFIVNVADSTLNLYFSSLASDGGINRPQVTAIEIIRNNKVPIASAGISKTIVLPVNSTVLNGSGSDADGTISSYKWTQVSGPNTANFSPGNNVATPTVGGLIAGCYVFSLVVTDNLNAASQPSLVTVNVDSVLYRVNAGGKQITNSIGTFAADSFYTPKPGYTYSVTTAINGTTDDAIYQTERSSTINNGTFNYTFPVNNGSYRVILHFSENYHTASGKRLFDVSAEGIKVLDNYDIFQKAGRFTATSESFTVNVTDGNLDLYFSALTSDGGVNRPKVSAIEIIGTTKSQTPSARKATTLDIVQQEAAIISGLRVFPNPSRGQFKILFPANAEGEISYKLSSSIGTELSNGKLQNIKPGSAVNFDFSSQMNKTGFYYLHFKGKKIEAVIKLIKGN